MPYAGFPERTCPPALGLLPLTRPVSTTMTSFQLTTDAPSPCPVLKVWKDWRPMCRVSSSREHEKGWSSGAWDIHFHLAPLFPSIPETH